ncbi:MAG: GFA family protein, partial [Acidiferrobacterales bacterium]
MAETKKTTGGCLCGAVRYETAADSEWAWYCHCNSCRKHTGAPVVMFVGFPEDKVEWPAGERALYESSPGV